MSAAPNTKSENVINTGMLHSIAESQKHSSHPSSSGSVGASDGHGGMPIFEGKMDHVGFDQMSLDHTGAFPLINGEAIFQQDPFKVFDNSNLTPVAGVGEHIKELNMQPHGGHHLKAPVFADEANLKHAGVQGVPGGGNAAAAG
jgi:hypothetical protein